MRSGYPMTTRSRISSAISLATGAMWTSTPVARTSCPWSVASESILLPIEQRHPRLADHGSRPKRDYSTSSVRILGHVFPSLASGDTADHHLGYAISSSYFHFKANCRLKKNRRLKQNRRYLVHWRAHGEIFF